MSAMAKLGKGSLGLALAELGKSELEKQKCDAKRSKLLFGEGEMRKDDPVLVEKFAQTTWHVRG